MDKVSEEVIANRRLWIEDLRSDKYIQGLGSLKRVNPDLNLLEHCCLGVACERFGFPLLNPEQFITTLVSLRTEEALDIKQDLRNHLAALNDKQVSFEDIAQLIEDHIEEPSEFFYKKVNSCT